MFGITRAPGVHGPLQPAGYTVVLKTCQTVPWPAGVVTLGRLVGEGMAQEPVAHPNWYPGTLWKDAPTWMP